MFALGFVCGAAITLAHVAVSLLIAFSDPPRREEGALGEVVNPDPKPLAMWVARD